MAPRLQARAKTLERQLISDNLNAKLYTREDMETLQQQNLFRAQDVAPRLRNKKIQLERAFTRDQVGHLLDSRPDPSDLRNAGILAEPVSARIQGAKKQLQHNMTIDKVGHLLEKRSEIGDLLQQNILQDVKVAPAIQDTQRTLKKNFARANLYHALKHRPSIIELQERGVYPEFEDYDDDEEEYYEDEGEYPYSDPSYRYQDQAQAQTQAELQEQSQNYQDQYEQDDSYNQRYQDDLDREQEQDSYGLGPSSEQKQYQYPTQEQYPQQSAPYEATNYQRRSKNFHLTRILLKFVAAMTEAGDITLQQKGILKDLIVDQDKTILAVAAVFDAENDEHDFKDSLTRLTARR